MEVLKVKHSKFKNTGIIFELLTKQITADILAGKKSAATNILKKYFVNTELSKEQKIYEALLSSKNLTESKASIVLNTVVDLSKDLNKTKLRNEKYNLIKEIKKYYNFDSFFKNKISNYREYATLNTLLENQDAKIQIQARHSLLNFLSTAKTENTIEEEFSKLDKETRLISYKILVDKFNEKYSSLNEDQKDILKEYINLADSRPEIVNFYNKKISYISSNLKPYTKVVNDQATRIKLTEVIKLLKPIDKNAKIKDDTLVNILSYQELLSELKKIHG